MKKSKKNYLQYLNPLELLQTKKVLQTHQDVKKNRKPSVACDLQLISYCNEYYEEKRFENASTFDKDIIDSNRNYWLNLDTINKNNVETIGKKLGYHFLILDDILTTHQRPKVDEIEGYLTCVLQMLYYNDELNALENEQVSFILSNNLIVTFQDDSDRDVFDGLRHKLVLPNTKVRTQGVDYLLYAMIDAVVDNYYYVLEKLAEQIEKMEEEMTGKQNEDYVMNRINNLRKELIFFKRNTAPVREMISNIIQSDSVHIKSNTIKYFKDVYDHILQINELSENYRDMVINLRDLYLSQMNIKLNEVMKFLAIVTTLLAPATVIGGIFGMNFDRIPYLHHQNGFWIATILMTLIPILMLMYFRRRGWF